MQGFNLVDFDKKIMEMSFVGSYNVRSSQKKVTVEVILAHPKVTMLKVYELIKFLMDFFSTLEGFVGADYIEGGRFIIVLNKENWRSEING